MNLRMTGRGDEIQKSVDAVVAEARVTLDTRLFGQNIIVLAVEVANDLLEATNRVRYIPEHQKPRTQIRCRCCRQSRACRRPSKQCGRRLPQALDNAQQKR